MPSADAAVLVLSWQASLLSGGVGRALSCTTIQRRRCDRAVPGAERPAPLDEDTNLTLRLNCAPRVNPPLMQPDPFGTVVAGAGADRRTVGPTASQPCRPPTPKSPRPPSNQSASLRPLMRPSKFRSRRSEMAAGPETAILESGRTGALQIG